ncbi:hypothetical protein [Streptomyces sp. NBC_00009]|uniref:hypothetical protein n=1 Tax=Streptomyces sp. NBC_00009 TaxID=2975620 RepID=UPI00324566A6
MASAYTRPISTHPETLQTQMQGYAVAAATDTRGDDQIGERPIRLDEALESQVLPLGADADKTATVPAPGCSSIH